MSQVRDAYLEEIRQKKEAIKNIVSRKFPYPCEVRSSYDSMETIIITLFCVPSIDNEAVLDKLADLVNDMETILEYLMVISQTKTPEVTKQYFPEYYLIQED